MQPRQYRQRAAIKARILATGLVVAGSFNFSARAQIGGGTAAGADVLPNTDTSTMISTGCGYDAWTGTSQRVVTDLVVPGAISEHGLKWTRTYNSSTGGWSFAYTWRYSGRPNGVGRIMAYPDGRAESQRYCSDGVTGCFDPGTKDRLLNPPRPVGDATGTLDFVLEDGSHIYMDCWSEQGNTDTATYWIDHVTPLQINDRYGRVTILDWQETPTGSYTPDQIRLAQVTDQASGRWIKITYYSDNSHRNDPQRIDTSNGDWVVYNWASGFLTDVYYSDGTSAHYTYDWARYNSHDPVTGDPTVYRFMALKTAKDTRAEGPMQSIQYEYRSPGNFAGEISMERDLLSDGAIVSMCDNKISPPDTSGTRTETGGYGPYSRQIHMATFKNTEKMPPMVMWKQDFNGNTEYFKYDANNYLTDVKDRNGNTTHYTLEPVIGNPTRITHPPTASDNGAQTHIDYGYKEAPIRRSDADNPYYISSVTDEKGNTITYKRDPTTHLITEIDYPDNARETFTYNGFGEVTVHQRRNGAYEYAQYDGTGLLLKAWNPTWTPPSTWGWSDADPHTTYSYYTSGNPSNPHVWQDRVQTVTDPRGCRTVYEYDHSFDANGNQTSTPCPGRGLVTKISYPDDTHNGQKPGGTSKSFTYDVYGNKLSETNELGKTTRYTYDDYMRLRTTTDPLQHVTTLDYTSTSGQSPYSHTTKSVRYHTSPTGVVTEQTFDNDLRLATKVEGAQDSSVAATTRYGHDPNGNLTMVTDPRGGSLGDPNHTTWTTYDARNRKETVTDALQHTTTFHYDNPSSDATRIDRPDGTTETKTYDPMHRVWTDTVPQTSSVSLTTTFIHNPSGTIYQVIDAKNQTTTFEYDPSDLKTKMTYPNGSEYQGWGYDDAKNLSSRRTVNGTTQNFTYDCRNRKIAMTWSNNADYANFDYDLAGRLTLAQNGASAVTRQYDDAGRMTLDRQNLGSALGNKDVQYLYDAADAETRLYVTSATYDYTFLYDPMGRFEKIFATGGSSPQYQYFYDVASNEIGRINNLNAVLQFYTPDNLNRMSRRDVKKGTATLSIEVYGYDPMSRLNSINREDGLTDSFTYYQDGELNTAQYGIASSTPPPSSGQDAATYVAQSVPSTMTPGGSYNVSVTMTNSGTSTWTSANYYGLGSQNPQDNRTWNPGRVALPSSVAPGAQVTFNFTVTAPSTAGTYNFQWRMVHDGVAWFGDYTPNVVVTDGSPPPPPTPTPPTGRCADVAFTESGGCPHGSLHVSMSTATAGAIIFYTRAGPKGCVNPTHNGSAPGSGTVACNSSSCSVSVSSGTAACISALAYESGLSDSNVTQDIADNVCQAPPPGPPGPPAIDTTGLYPATMDVSMSAGTAGATIFYTYSDSGYVPPSHDGLTPTGSTLVYAQPIPVNPGTIGYFGAVVYVNGVGDSDVTQFQADNTASAAIAAADPSDVDLLLSMPTVAVDPGVTPSGTGSGPTNTGTIAASSTPRNVTYNLDQAGNRLSVVDTGVSKSYTPNNLNQYTAAQGSTVTNGREHELASYQGIAYTYINDERLKTVTAGSNNSYQLAYDALGRCVKRTVNNATNYYIYDGEKAILSYNTGGAIVARNLYGKWIDEILMRTDNVLKKTYYFQQDHEGSVTHLIEGTGTVTEKYKYDAFGAPTMYNAGGAVIASSAYGNRALFTGREYDSTFGIYEYRARAYHPGLGRFMSEDPKGFAAGDYNLFRYCHNDPEDLTDPMGLTVILYDPYKPTREQYHEGVKTKTAYGSEYNAARNHDIHNKDGSVNEKARSAFRAVEESKTLKVTFTKTKELNYDAHHQFSGYVDINKKNPKELLGGSISVPWNPNSARENTNLSRNSPAAILLHEMWHFEGMVMHPETAKDMFRPGMFGSGTKDESRVFGLERQVFPHLRNEGVRDDLSRQRYFYVADPTLGGRE